jgi:hypothetical protein
MKYTAHPFFYEIIPFAFRVTLVMSVGALLLELCLPGFVAPVFPLSWLWWLLGSLGLIWLFLKQ